MKSFLIYGLLITASILNARENTKLTTIYTEFTETVTVQYSRTIKIKQTQIDNQNQTSVADIVHYWNNLVSSRKTNSLFNLYAPKVLYYGSEVSDKACIKDKKSFYRKHPFFSQSIDNLQIIHISRNLYKVYFDKYVKLKENSKIRNYPSYLVIRFISERPYIFVEGDSITDKNLLKKYGR